MDRGRRGVSSRMRGFCWSVLVLVFAAVEAMPMMYDDRETGVTPVRSMLEGNWNTTCVSQAPLPEDAADYLGCLYGIDLSTVSVAADVVSLISGDNPTSMEQIVESMLVPLQAVTNKILKSKVPAAKDNVCFGNWKVSDLDMDGCDILPLQGSSNYTILSIDIEVPMTGVCEEKGSANFCVGVSLCPDTYLPTIAVNVAATTLACIAEDVAEFDAGISTIATKAAEFAVDSIGFGLSLSQQFETPLHIYTALDGSDNKLITYTLHGMFYEQIVIDVDPSKWFGKDVPEIIAFGGKATRSMAINGLDSGTINDVFSGYSASYDSKGNLAEDVANSFLTFAEEVSIQFGIKIELTMQLLFHSKMKNKLSKVLPDTQTMDLLEADAFMQTAATTETINGNEVTVRPGLYAFAGIGALANVISGLVDWFLTFVMSIINLGGDWLPFNVSSLDFINKIIDSMKTTGGDDFGFGFAITDESMGLLLNAPLIFADLGYFKLECRFTWDDAELHCSVETGLNKHFFIALAELTEQGVLWLARETDEAFEKLGNLIAAGLEDAVDAASVWVEDNVKETVSMIKDGVIEVDEDLKKELDNWVGWGETVFGEVADDISEFTKEAIHDVSKYGKAAVDDAEKAFKDAEMAVENTVKDLEKAFGCGKDSIMSAVTGCSDCCKGLNNAIDWLEGAGQDIDKAFEAAWKSITSFVDDVSSFFYSQRTSRSYRSFNPKQYDTVYTCEKQQIYETKKTVVMGIVVDKKTSHVGDTLDAGCMKGRISNSQSLQNQYSVLQAKNSTYVSAQKDNADALYGSTVSASDLIAAGFFCDMPVIWRNATTSDGKIPVTVKCHSSPIAKDGKFSNTTVNAEITEAIDLSSMGNSAAADIAALKKSVGQALTREITLGFNAPTSECKASEELPSDGTDNNCDGLIDDQVCNFDDFDGDVSARDCTCAAPILDKIDDVQLVCSADRSPSTLGYPTVTTDVEHGCSSGVFFGVSDKLANGSDPITNCGAGTYVRTFQYFDSHFQRSNVVTQKITTTSAPPTLNTTLVEPLVYMACELPVGDHGQNAPAEDVPATLGASNCASQLSSGYQDGDIDYVGCPVNPPVNHTSYKGWNVDRTWFVEDTCGQSDHYVQRIVRTDETSPTYETVPVMRVQSCRANFEPGNSGYPIAVDNCDPVDVLNPDWTQAEGSRGGRMTYNDSGESTTGCAIDMVRTFTTKDRVCNSAMASQNIQAYEFDFVPMSQSSTPYDQFTFLASFSVELNVGQGPISYDKDQLVYVSETLEKLQVHSCMADDLPLQYLNTSANNLMGGWNDMPTDIGLSSSDSVQLDSSNSSPTFRLTNDPRRNSYFYGLFASSVADFPKQRITVKFGVNCILAESGEQVRGHGVFQIVASYHEDDEDRCQGACGAPGRENCVVTDNGVAFCADCSAIMKKTAAAPAECCTYDEVQMRCVSALRDSSEGMCMRDEDIFIINDEGKEEPATFKRTTGYACANPRDLRKMGKACKVLKNRDGDVVCYERAN